MNCKMLVLEYKLVHQQWSIFEGDLCMARVTVGVVFLADIDAVDRLMDDLRHLNSIELVHIEQSYGKLWIKKGDAP